MPRRELSRPVLAARRRPRLGTVATAALLVFLTSAWAYASRSDASRADIERVAVKYQQPPDVEAAYVTATGASPKPEAGPSACAHGVPDERSWSRPGAPHRVVGRFTCRISNGRAEMWWTDGDTLAHAVAPHADLATLFAWWLAQETA